MNDGRVKTCSRCGQTKSTDDFYRDSRSKDFRAYMCKACRYDKSDGALYRAELRVRGLKKCSTCGEEMELSNFHKMKQSHDGYYPRCKECRKAHDLPSIRKIPENHYTMIVEARRMGKSIQDIAEHYNVKPAIIYRVIAHVRGKTKSV